MKFDLVMGNPPYQFVQNGKKRDAAANLYPHFVVRGFDHLEDGGYILMVTPNGWMTPSADIGKGKTGIRIFDLMKKYSTVVINPDCSNHFPDVGSSFTYFVIQKVPNNKIPTMIITKEKSFSIQLSEMILLPSTLTELNASITSKVIAQSTPIGFSNNNTPEGGEFEKNSIDEKDENHPIATLHSSANGGTYRYTKDILNTVVQKRKVLVPSSGYYLPVYDKGDLAFSAKNYVYYLKNNETLDSIKSYIDSRLVRFILNITTSGWISSAFRLLPKLDLTRTWTDQELYAHFGLTDEEIHYIEEQVK